MIMRWFLAELGRSQPWERRIASAASTGSDEAILRRARSTLTTILRANLLPFWTGRIPEAAGNDGVILAEQRDGRRVLNVVLLARYLWFAASLCASKSMRWSD